MGENKESRSILLTCVAYPRIQVIFGGHDSFRDPLEIDVDEFIGIKSFKAKGKRISTYNIEQINELEPLRFPEPSKEEDGGGRGDMMKTKKLPKLKIRIMVRVKQISLMKLPAR